MIKTYPAPNFPTKILLVSLAAFALLLVSIKYNTTVVGDETFWHLEGFLWKEFNILPYSGTVDDKAPGLATLYRASHEWFGSSFFEVRFLGYLSILLTGFFLSRLLSELEFSKKTILCAIPCFLLLHAWPQAGADYLHSAETFLNLFCVLGFFLYFRYKESSLAVFLCGMSLGGALFFRQSAIFSTAGFCLFLIYRKRYSSLKHFLFLGFGIAICTLVFLIPLLSSGLAFSDFFRGVWLQALTYGSGRGASLTARYFYFCLAAFGDFRFLWIPLVIWIWVRVRTSKLSHLEIFSLIWFLSDLFAIEATGFINSNTVRQAFPSSILLLSFLLESIPAHFRPELWMSLLFLPQVFYLQCHTLAGDIFKFGSQQAFSAWRYPKNEFAIRIADEIQKLTTPNETVYVFSRHKSTLFLTFARRKPASRIISLGFLYGRTSSELPIPLKLTIDDLTNSPPKLILLPESISVEPYPVPEWLSNLVSRNYRYIRTSEGWKFYTNDATKRTK